MKVGLIVALFLCWTVSATEIFVGETYRLTNGSLETTSGFVIPQNSLIKVAGPHRGWAYEVQLVDESFKVEDEVYIVSQNWVARTAEALTLDEVVSMVIHTQEQVPEATEAPCVCDHDQEAVNAAVSLAMSQITTSAPEVSLRPRAREDNIPAPPQPQRASLPNVRSNVFETFTFKEQRETDQYFACYQKSADLRNDYEARYRPAIMQMARTYGQRTAGVHYQGDVDTLMSCLIFRESAHWQGGSSSTGARGLGQFTSDGRAEVREVLEYRPERVRDHDERINERRAERQAGRITQAQLNRDIRTIEAERTRHYRLTELKRLWESMPMDNRPSASQITGDYTGNNNNYQAIFAMSSLLLRNCQIRLRDDGINMDSRTSLLACAGAYNIGVGGFMQNAIVRDGPQTLEGWLQNLRSSSDPQAAQTHNHLVSIHRCISADENFPPCGTKSNYCQALPMANACQFNADPMCLGECP